MPHRIPLLSLCLLAILLRVGAQPLGSRGSLPTIEVVHVGVLPDRGYAWDHIRTDPALAFRPADSLHPAQARRFWLQVAVRNWSSYTEAAQLALLPNLDNTLFYFDENARAWQVRRAGAAVSTDSQQPKGRLPLRLPGHATTTFYVQVNLPTGATLPRAIPLRFTLEAAAAAQKTEQLADVAWAVSLAVLLLLLLTNLLAYLRFRDRITLYYSWSQVGAMLYITVFRVSLPLPTFSLLVAPTGLSYSYTLSNVLMHLSVLLLLLGAVQMTRAYLLTRAHLPRLDAGLRYALGGYGAFSLVVALVNLSGFYLNYYTLRYDNLLVLGVVGLLLTTTVVAYRQRLPLARPYLLANALPLLFMLLVAGYQGVFGYANATLLLPNLAIVSHALGFAAALSLRLQALQRTLLAKEQEAAFLTLDIAQQKLRHREIVLKNTHIQTALGQLERQQQAREQHTRQLSADNEQHQAANQELQEQLEANQRELASTTLYVTQKNALLAELKQHIEELHAQSPSKQSELAGIQSLLQTSLYLDEDWSKFKRHFEQVHPRFFEELQAKYPALTKNEQRLHCYFHIHLSTKEIAALLNIDPASVRRAKSRLFKKMAAADVAAGRTPPAELPDEPRADD